MPQYLIYVKNPGFLDLSGPGLGVTDAAKDDWSSSGVPETRVGLMKKNYPAANNIWQVLALDINKWFGEILSNGKCDKKAYGAKVDLIKNKYGHRGAQEFVSVFPVENALIDKVSGITEKLFAKGNDRKAGDTLDISDLLTS